MMVLMIKHRLFTVLVMFSESGIVALVSLNVIIMNVSRSSHMDVCVYVYVLVGSHFNCCVVYFQLI